MKTKLKPCPNCGDGSGYYFKMFTPYTQFIDLNEDPLFVEDSSGAYEHKLLHCQNCRKGFRRKTITNTEGDE